MSGLQLGFDTSKANDAVVLPAMTVTLVGAKGVDDAIERATFTTALVTSACVVVAITKNVKLSSACKTVCMIFPVLGGLSPSPNVVATLTLPKLGKTYTNLN